ncbi:hypothetical protein EV426DRAFT_527802, partial [Tirmania nivea]
LQEASAGRHETTVAVLIDMGVNVNPRTGRWWFGSTALQVAIEHGHETIVKLLVDREADVNCKGSGGTALQAAAEH